ncbi:MAG: amidohydrolase family protein [Acidobacteria bacterium]|nr:amidohydrolase family protein [Acidobacteriota bacterium]
MTLSKQFSPGQFGLLLLCFAVASGTASGQDTSTVLEKLRAYPDLVLVNGNIVTMDSGQRRYRAMAVRQGRIVALGSDTEIRALRGPKTEVLNAKGRTVLPGLIDSHTHPHLWAIPHWFSGDWAAKRYNNPELEIVYVKGTGATDLIPKTEQAVRQRAGELGSGKWIWIVLWASDNLREARDITYPLFDRNRPMLIREMLDDWAPENPVMVFGPSVSAPSINNNKAQAIMKRVRGSEVSGMAAYYTAVYDILLGGQPEAIADLLRQEMLNCLTRYGITSFSSTVWSTSVLQGARLLEERGELPARWGWVHDMGFAAENPAEFYRRLGDFRGHGSDSLWNIGMGNSVWERLPWACTQARPLENPPQKQGAASIPVNPIGGQKLPCPDSLRYDDSSYQTIRSALESGLRPTYLDAYNDGTYDAVFRMLEELIRAGKLTPAQVKQLRLGIDHNLVVRPDQIEKIARYGLMPSFGGYQLYEDIKGPAFLRQFGEEYKGWLMPVKSLVNAGVHMTLGTDAHLTPIPRAEAQPMDWPRDWEGSVWKFMQFFVTRKMTGDPRQSMAAGRVFQKDQGISRVEALKAATIHGAEMMLREKDLGTLEPGKLADFIIIDKDYFTIPEEQIGKIENLLTAVGGKVLYKNSRF